MKNIIRNTAVISISLPKKVVDKLEEEREVRGQSRSAFISALIDQAGEEERWRRIYKLGKQTAKRLGITSEEDIDRILHED